MRLTALASSTLLSLSLGLAALHAANVVADTAVGGPEGLVLWGDGTDNVGTIPPNLDRLGIRDIKAASNFYVVLRNDGTVVDSTNSNYFGLQQGMGNVVQIATGRYHALALKSDGTVVAWGQNGLHQLEVPANLTGVVRIGAGASSCFAIKADGSVVAWGSWWSGSPVTLQAGLAHVTDIAGGEFHVSALLTGGSVVSWSDPAQGWTTGWGPGTVGKLPSLGAPSGQSGFAAIASNHYASTVLKQDGSLVTWGWGNNSGTVGVYPPAGLNTVQSFASGRYHTTALFANHSVATWGWTDGGMQVSKPGAPTGLGNVRLVGAQENYSLAWVQGAPPTATLAATTAVETLGNVYTYALQVADAETPANQLLTSATAPSAATALVRIDGAGANRTLSVIPLKAGPMSVIVSVSDRANVVDVQRTISVSGSALPSVATTAPTGVTMVADPMGIPTATLTKNFPVIFEIDVTAMANAGGTLNVTLAGFDANQCTVTNNGTVQRTAGQPPTLHTAVQIRVAPLVDGLQQTIQVVMENGISVQGSTFAVTTPALITGPGPGPGTPSDSSSDSSPKSKLAGACGAGSGIAAMLGCFLALTLRRQRK